MTKKDEKETPREDSSQIDDDLDSLSLDEKAAFEKIMAEISETNLSASAVEKSTDLPDAKVKSADPSSPTENLAAQDSEPPQDQDLSDDQQAALDKIMAEINARESAKQAEPEPAPDDEPTADGKVDDELSDDQQAALDKIMAEINARESAKQAEPEPVPDEEPTPAGKDDDELSDDQQAALDKIMAEINARESAKQAEPEPVPDEPTPAGKDDDELSDDQQAALDKIMADINARESAKQAEPEPVPDEPTAAENEDEIKQSSKKEIEKLSLDEFNDELTNLLSAAQQKSTGVDEKAVPSLKGLSPSKPVNDKQPPAMEPETPQLKNGPATQNSQPTSGDPGKAAETPFAARRVQMSESTQQDYAILHEVDATQLGKPKLKKNASRRGRSRSRSGSFIKIAAGALVLLAMAGSAYWAHDLLVNRKFSISWDKNPPADVSLSSNPAGAERAADRLSPAKEVPAPPETPARAPQQASPATFGSLKSDLESARQQINSKIEEIVKLKAHYQKGIIEEQLKIKAELKVKPARSLEIAQANSQIDLSIRAIQRRMVYIAKLDTPLKRLEAASEDLLYLERRTQFYETLSQWISGPSFPEYKQEIAGRIATHLKVTTELTVDDIRMDPPSMASVWADVQAGMDKEDKTVANEAKRNDLDQQISREICKGDFGRKYLLTTLSAETAQCLTQWKGKDLYLNGLTELSPQSAKILSQWSGEWLSLNGINEISVETAKYLSQWPGKRLSLNGLEKLSARATAQLSRWKGEQLEMIGLTAIGRWENYATRLYLSETLRRKLQM